MSSQHLVYEYDQFFFVTLSYKLSHRKNKKTIKNFNMTLEISANFCFDIILGIIKQTTYQQWFRLLFSLFHYPFMNLWNDMILPESCVLFIIENCQWEIPVYPCASGSTFTQKHGHSGKDYDLMLNLLLWCIGVSTEL